MDENIIKDAEKNILNVEIFNWKFNINRILETQLEKGQQFHLQ